VDTNQRPGDPPPSAEVPHYATATPDGWFGATPPSRSDEERARDESNALRAGALILLGVVLRLSSYVLPWIVAKGNRTVSMNLVHIGASPFPAIVTLVAAVFATGYLTGSEWAKPTVIASIGLLAVVGTLLDLSNLIAGLHAVAPALDAQAGLAGVRIAVGTGPLAELAGAILLLAGGLWATTIWHRTPSTDYVPAPLDGLTDRPETARALRSWLVAGILVVFAIVLFGAAPGAISLPYKVVGAGRPQQAAPAPLPSAQSPTPAPSASPPVALPPPAVAPKGPDATSYQVDAAHDGNAGRAHVRLPLTRAWVRRWNGGTVGYPLIAGGRVFVALVQGTKHVDSIVALDARTGTVAWQVPQGAGNDTIGIAFDRGTLFVLQPNGLLSALAAKSGSPKWSTKLTSELGFDAPPTASGGVVYAVSAGNQTNVYAVSEATGQIASSTSFAFADPQSATVAGVRVYVPLSCLGAAAFSYDLRSTAWTKQPCQNADGEMAPLYRGRLYVRNGDAGFVLDARSGKKVGTFLNGAMPAFAGTTAYTVWRGALVATPLTSTKPLWRFAPRSSVGFAPLALGHDVCVAARDGRLYLLSAQGRVLASLPLGQVLDPNDDRAGAVNPLPEGAGMRTGMNAGDGLLVVDAADRLVAFR